MKARSLSLSAIALVACACAHARVPRPPLESVRIAGVEFALRHTAEDDAVAEQVSRALRRAAPIAARWGSLPATVRVTIHATHRELEAAAHRMDHAWLRAWATPGSIDLQSPRTWSRGSATDDELVQLLAHELTHCVMYRWARSAPGPDLGIPLWFREGMASVTAGDQRPMPREAILRFYRAARDGARRGDPLTHPEPLYREDSQLVYGTADRAFRFLVDRYGEERVRELLSAMGRGARFPDAFRSAVGIPTSEFEGAFRADVLEGAPGAS